MEKLAILEQAAFVLTEHSPLTHATREDDVVDSIYELIEMYEELGMELEEVKETLRDMENERDDLLVERDDLAYDLEECRSTKVDLERDIEFLEQKLDDYLL